MAIAPVVTLRCVPTKNTKKLFDDPLKAFSRTLRQWVDARHKGNATHAAKALGVSQPHMSSMLSGDRGPGLNTLILLRAETGKTIDEILGFAASPETDLENRLVANVEFQVGKLEAEIRELRERLPTDPVPVRHAKAK